jgi:hypothetical protein
LSLIFSLLPGGFPVYPGLPVTYIAVKEQPVYIKSHWTDALAEFRAGHDKAAEEGHQGQGDESQGDGQSLLYS